MLLNNFSKRLGVRCLQIISQHSAWHQTLRCVAIREKQLTRCNNRIAVVRCAVVQRIIVKPNDKVTIRGYIDKRLPYQQTCAIMQPHPQASLDLDIDPSLLSYNHNNTDTVEVTLSNLSTNTVRLDPKTILCELQPVVITSLEAIPEKEEDSIWSQIPALDPDILSKQQMEIGKNLIHDFEDIFSHNEEDAGFYNKVRHQINLLMKNHSSSVIE